MCDLGSLPYIAFSFCEARSFVFSLSCTLFQVLDLCWGQLSSSSCCVFTDQFLPCNIATTTHYNTELVLRTSFRSPVHSRTDSVTLATVARRAGLELLELLQCCCTSGPVDQWSRGPVYLYSKMEIWQGLGALTQPENRFSGCIYRTTGRGLVGERWSAVGQVSGTIGSH